MFLPATRLGRAACWLALAFVAWWFVNQAVYVAAISGREPAGAFRTAVIAASWVGMAAGLAAGLVGLAAIVRRKERAVAVYLALVPGAFALLFLAGELLLPH